MPRCCYLATISDPSAVRANGYPQTHRNWKRKDVGDRQVRSAFLFSVILVLNPSLLPIGRWEVDSSGPWCTVFNACSQVRSPPDFSCCSVTVTVAGTELGYQAKAPRVPVFPSALQASGYRHTTTNFRSLGIFNQTGFRRYMYRRSREVGGSVQSCSPQPHSEWCGARWLVFGLRASCDGRISALPCGMGPSQDAFHHPSGCQPTDARIMAGLTETVWEYGKSYPHHLAGAASLGLPGALAV